MNLTQKNKYKADFKKELDKFADKLEKYVSTDKGDWTVKGFIDVSRPEIGLHELTCKQDEKIRKEHPRTGVYCSRVFNWGFYVS